MVSDLPDYTKMIAVNVDISVESPFYVIPKPMGGKIAKGNITTTGSYQTVAELAITTAKTFQLTKILISCDQDIMYKIRWNGTDISTEVIVPANIPFTDWFPWNYYTMLGNGTKKIDIQAKYPTDGYGGTCYAEINGEEV